MSKRIHLWLDRVGTPDEPRWIVSLDDDTTSETIRTFPEDCEDDAFDFAFTHARNRGLVFEDFHSGAVITSAAD